MSTTTITTWRDLAACKGQTDLMFDTKRVSEAKALCAGCEVLDQCKASLRIDRPDNNRYTVEAIPVDKPNRDMTHERLCTV